MHAHNYPDHITLSVKWGDMDALGHVNNIQYFRYTEEARIQLFQRLGFESLVANVDEGPILAHTACQFISPLLYPDTLTVGTWIPKVGNTSMHIYHDLISEQQQSIIAKVTSVVVMLNHQTQTKMPVSQNLRDTIQGIQKGFDLSAF